MIRCMWVDRESDFPNLEFVQCDRTAVRFFQERDGVCWAWCQNHARVRANVLAGHSGGEIEITEQEYIIHQVQNS